MTVNGLMAILVYVRNISTSKNMSFFSFSQIVSRVTVIFYMWFKSHYPHILLVSIGTTTFILGKKIPNQIKFMPMLLEQSIKLTHIFSFIQIK